MQLTLIQSPPYIIDFQEFSPSVEKKESSLIEKVQTIALTSLQYVKAFFSAFLEAAYSTLSYSGVSFKYIVLGYYGSLLDFHPPKDIYLAVFRVAFWILGMGWCLATTTTRLFLEKIPHETAIYLKHFASDEMNIRHLKTDELVLDVSEVPPEVRVDDLEQIFLAINFDEKNQPGYLSPSSRQEGSKVYTAEELKESLKKFITNVNNRVAFLGTPPSYDVPRLMAFYQHMENAVRLSIHKVNENLRKFQETHGNDLADYDETQKRQYANLLEDRSRVALDLAIAGNHCGSRYMGDAMSVYYGLYSENVLGDKNLEESLIEILAHKRREIALSHIQRHLGTDTHSFNKYMANLGPLLGIPGTKDIIEHLDRNFNPALYLGHFFEEYTVDFIIEAIQGEIKKSQALREKIIDWMGDRFKDWKKDLYHSRMTAIKEQIQPILTIDVPNPIKLQQLKDFKSFIAYLRKDSNSWPGSDLNWKDFIEELFASSHTRNWMAAHYSKLNSLERSKKIKDLKTTFSEEIFSDPLKPWIMENAEINEKIFSNPIGQWILDNESLDEERIKQGFLELDKIEEIKKVISLSKETLTRALRGQLDWEEAILSDLDHQRRSEFVSTIIPADIHEKGISPGLMEWLLVSQNILLPQTHIIEHR